jgi:hypothetical protein
MNGVKYLLDTNIILGMYQHSAAVIALMQSKQIARTKKGCKPYNIWYSAIF